MAATKTPSRPSTRWLSLLWGDDNGQVNIGFTGTQKGMTDEQYDTVDRMVKAIVRATSLDVVAHHGDCVGADADFHDICEEHRVVVETHPANMDTKRAFKRAKVVHPTMPPLVRNRVIVDSCSLLIVTPRSTKEQVRSGTWATVRYARQCGRVMWIAMPDGSTMVDPRAWGEVND